LQQFCPRLPAILFLRQFKAAHRPWDACGTPSDQAVASQLSVSVQIHVAGGLAGSSFAEIDECRPPIGHADEHESATADIAGKGMGHGKGETDGNSGIHRVSARFQDRDTDVSRQGFLGDDHAFAGKDRFVGVRLRRYQSETQYQWKKSSTVGRSHGSGL